MRLPRRSMSKNGLERNESLSNRNQTAEPQCMVHTIGRLRSIPAPWSLSASIADLTPNENHVFSDGSYVRGVAMGADWEC